MPGTSIKNSLVHSIGFYAPSTDHTSSARQNKKINTLFNAEPVAPCFEWASETKASRVAKTAMSWLVFPFAIYDVLHRTIGRELLPSSHDASTRIDSLAANTMHSEGWRMKRIAVKVDGIIIDALILGKESTLANGKWMLVSNGREEQFEQRINNGDEVRKILANTEFNALYFNYPGVGASSDGPPSRKALENTYRAMLSFLENKTEGVGAKEIIGYGYSIGCGIQAEALQNHKLKSDIKYLFIKNKAFSSLPKVCADNMTNAVLGKPRKRDSEIIRTIRSILKFLLEFHMKAFGWNIDTLRASKALKSKQIILQASITNPSASPSRALMTLRNPHDVVDDSALSAECSLAENLLREKHNTKGLNKSQDREIYGTSPDSPNKFTEKEISFLSSKIKQAMRVNSTL